MKKDMLKKYLFNILIAIDRLVNSVIGGDPDETISHRAYDHYPRLAKVINWLFRNKKHCEEATDENTDGIIN